MALNRTPAQSRSYSEMRKLNNLILAFLVLMFLADGANSILFNLGYTSGVSIYVRLLAEAFFLLILLRTRQGLPVLLILIFFYTVMLIGSLAYPGVLASPGDYAFLEGFRNLNKMLFVFIAWETFSLYFNTPAERSKLFRVYEILTLIQVFVILCAFTFDIKLFASYIPKGEGLSADVRRFGYQGLVPSQNEVAAYFIVAFFYFFLKFRSQPGFVNFITLVATTAAGVLTGTKVTLVLPAFLLLFFAYVFIKSRSRNFRYLMLLAGLLLLSVGGWVALRSQSYILDRIEPTLSYYAYRMEQNPFSPLLNILIAPRVNKASTLINNYLPEFNLINYLFGGVDLTQYSSETDLLDIFARLGAIGGLAYYILYLRLLLYPEERVSLIRLSFVALWLGVSATAGHIAFTAINGPYLAILVLAFISLESKNFVQEILTNGDQAAVVTNPAIS